jgi:hypothetical protein
VVLVGSTTLGALGAIGVAVGFAAAPTQAAFSYLTAWAYAVSIALGGLIFLMIGHATGARWVIVFRSFTEAIVASLPVLAVLFVPIALSLDRLYPWVDPSPALGEEALVRLAHKAPYLNVTAFMVRAAGFFVLWIVIGELLMRWSSRAGHEDRRHGPRLRALSAAGFPPVALALTFAAFDWLMSLTPAWYSTIFGLLYFSGGFVAALSVVAVIAHQARRAPVVASSIHPSHTGALGRLLFAFLVFWAYMEFSQGIIIWIANKPDEVPWYVARGAGAWGDVFAVLVIGHFAIPFFALLSKPLKRRPALLALAGAWLLALHYVDVYWLVMPVLHPTLALHWLDLAAPCAVVGLATAFATARARHPMPDGDPQFASALRYEGT